MCYVDGVAAEGGEEGGEFGGCRGEGRGDGGFGRFGGLYDGALFGFGWHREGVGIANA